MPAVMNALHRVTQRLRERATQVGRVTVGRAVERAGMRRARTLALADPLATAVRSRLELMARERVVQRLWSADYTLWDDRPDEIVDRLGWLEIDADMADEAQGLEAFAAGVIAEGYRHAVVLGMGGSGLGAELLSGVLGAGRHGLGVRVLSTTDPATIHSTVSGLDVARTLFVVASKSGSTIEPLALLDHFWSVVPDGRHFVAVTDAGTPLAQLALERDFRAVFVHTAAGGPLRGGANMGGRYSALSYFGLVPAALAGAPLGPLLAQVRAMRERCGPGVPVAENPGALLGAVLGESARSGRDKLTLLLPRETAFFGPWIEQLVAESTGKDGSGILPIVGEPLGRPAVYGPDRLFVSVGGAGGQAVAALERAGHSVVRLPRIEQSQLGAECYRWEFATAVAGHVMGIQPFNQPNVQEAKDATAHALDQLSAGTIEAAPTPRPGELLATLRPGDYVALQAYAPPTAELDALLQAVRLWLRDRYHVATSIGYGPAFLHSTGQLHKGGPPSGVFLVYVADDEVDLPIPGRPFTFGQLKRAQAIGDLACLREHDRRVSWLTRAELEALSS